jgi:N-acetyltransferase
MTGMEFHHPVVLDGRWVALVPLALDHVPQLAKIGQDPGIWTYVRHGAQTTPERMRAYVEAILHFAGKGEALPFVIFLKKEGVPVGMTQFLEIRREDRGVEIGGTWITPRLWRTPVNTESKYLLLRHAFEKEGCLRVQLKTDRRNVRSQKAIERLGATKEGIFRKHLVLPDGYVRDSVYYSIVDDEWPQVKARLQGFLEEGWAGPGAGQETGPE